MQVLLQRKERVFLYGYMWEGGRDMGATAATMGFERGQAWGQMPTRAGWHSTSAENTWVVVLCCWRNQSLILRLQDFLVSEKNQYFSLFKSFLVVYLSLSLLNEYFPINNTRAYGEQPRILRWRAWNLLCRRQGAHKRGTWPNLNFVLIILGQHEGHIGEATEYM